jgi:chromosome segregation ATPase
MAELRRQIAAMSDEIAADEAALSEIASATLPAVTPDVLRFHNERLADAQGTVAKIRDALAASKAELAALEAASDPVIDLRRQLADTLAMQALGSASAEDVSAIEGKIAASENVASATSSKAKRLAATVAGLEQRLSLAQADLDRLASATPTLQAECLAPELGQAETRYRDALAAMVQASDGYRALAHILTTIRPEATPAPLPEVIASLKDPGQLRLAQAIEAEQERLASLGI